MVWSHFGRHATVNKVHNTADLSREPHPKFLSTIMNVECSNYSGMQICPHWRFTPEYINKHAKKKTHYSENLPRAKRLLIAQIFNSRRTIVVNKRCSPTTRCFYPSRKLIRTSPRRTTWLFWCTTLTKNVGENKGGNKSHKTGHKIFFCVCCSSNHMELGERNGLSMLAFFHF